LECLPDLPLLLRRRTSHSDSTSLPNSLPHASLHARPYTHTFADPDPDAVTDPNLFPHRVADDYCICDRNRDPRADAE
jgi:hypothetical protein